MGQVIKGIFLIRVANSFPKLGTHHFLFLSHCSTSACILADRLSNAKKNRN